MSECVGESDGVARARTLAAEWIEWSETRSTPRIDAFRDAAEMLLAALDGRPTPPDQSGGA